MLLEGDSLSLHHSVLLSLIHWGIYGITVWVRKIQSFFIVLYWDWEWGVDQSYGCTKIAVFQLLSIAMFQIMCFKTKMKVCYNTGTSCLFVFLTFLLMYWRINWSITKWVQNMLIFPCIEAAGEVLISSIIFWSC